MTNRLFRSTLVFGGLVAWADVASAQNSSLYQRDIPANNGTPNALAQGSWTYVPAPPPQPLRKHDKVAVRVDIKSRVNSEGEIQRRKTANYDALLADWVKLDGLRWIKPSPASDGDPRVKGQLSQQFRALGELETSESLKYEIAAEISDIRPNGMLVLEAHQQVKNNNEVWEFSMSGLCDPKDIGPGGVILSRDIVELKIDKRERGHVRDSYKRGWFVRWFDQFSPF